MDTPRRSTRLRESVSYLESPNNPSPILLKRSNSDQQFAVIKKDEEMSDGIETRPRRGRKSKPIEPESNSPKKLRRVRTPSTKALESIVFESSPTAEKLAETPDKNRRKSQRIRTPNLRTNDINAILGKGFNKKSRKVEDVSKNEECESRNDDEEAEEEQESTEEESIEIIELDDTLDNSNDKENTGLKQPTALFDDDEDVEGKRLYSFKTPKKAGGMVQLANQTPKTPRHHEPDSNKSTPKTPKNLRITEIQKTPTSRPSAAKCTKTPRHVRDEIKKSKFN